MRRTVSRDKIGRFTVPEPADKPRCVYCGRVATKNGHGVWTCGYHDDLPGLEQL